MGCRRDGDSPPQGPRGDSADGRFPSPIEVARLCRAPSVWGGVFGGASRVSLVSNACHPLLLLVFSSRRQRTTRLARSRNADRREAQLAVAWLPSRSPWLVPCRYAPRSNPGRVGSRSSWQRDLQRVSVQPQRLPLHASLVQETLSGSMSVNSPAHTERAPVGSFLMTCMSGREVMQVELADPQGVEHLHSLR